LCWVFAIVKQKTNLFAKSQPKKETPVASKTQNNSQAQSAPAASTVLPSGLTDQEKQILVPPKPDASNEQKAKHYQLATQMAKEADTLTLNNCEIPTPLVYQVKMGADIQITNNSENEITISFDPDHKYTIPANATQAIQPKFKQGQGIYGYGCSNQNRLVGFLYLVP
jgi:hypothetical protein